MSNVELEKASTALMAAVQMHSGNRQDSSVDRVLSTASRLKDWLDEWHEVDLIEDPG